MEYCAKENLDITGLADADLKAIAHSYLAGFNPTQTKIDIIRDIRNGKLTPDQAIENFIGQAVTAYKNKPHHVQESHHGVEK